MKKALAKIVDCVVSGSENTEKKILAVSHCNCRERALEVQRMLLERMEVKSGIILDTAGISSMYANDGGIIIVI